MKRLICLLLMLSLLAGCGGPTHDDIETGPTEPQVTEPAASEPEPSPELAYLRENLPVMDGSTSLIPLEAGIRAAIFGISQEEAAGQVVHSSTWEAFYNLIGERVDLIFTCPLSEEQLGILKEEQVELEQVPVAMEGFVFVVNKDNPVDSLTKKQLRQIYSGQITNWKEVGGNDEPIIAYQRNSDSGSQNHMLEFMGSKYELMDAPVELRPATMEGLMDVVAVNDNASGAIGYTVYSYASDMYANGDEIKFLQIKGVAPSKETFADRSYPLLSQNYAVFRADEPEDSPVRRLVRWLTSYDGQLAVAKAGYVTEEDIGFDYQEMTFTHWSGTGTGPEAGEPVGYAYTLTQVAEDQWGESYSSYLPVRVKNGVVRVRGLADDALEDDIDEFIAEQMEWVPDAHESFAAWLDRQNEYGAYSGGLPYTMSGFVPEDLDYTCLVTASNGYLSVAITVCGVYDRGEGEPIFYRTETATWDLLTGKRLKAEDLFCQGVDIDDVLNEYVRRYSQSPLDSWSTYPQMKQDFVALPDHGWSLTHDALYIDMDNPYFATGVCIPLKNLPDGVLAAQMPREFPDAWEGKGVLYHRDFRVSNRDVYYEYNEDYLVSCGLLDEDVHVNADAINDYVMDYLNTHYTEYAIEDWYMVRGVSMEEVEVWLLDWDLYNLGGRYLVFEGSRPYHMAEGEEQVIYPYPPILLFELETGERPGWDVLLLEGWQEAATVALLPEAEGVEAPELEDLDLEELDLDNIYLAGNGSVVLRFLEREGTYQITVPWNYVNHIG